MRPWLKALWQRIAEWLCPHEAEPELLPCLYVMHDWANADWRVERPYWPPVGAWMWWGWDELAHSWAKADEYLELAEQQSKPTALSIMLYAGINADATPLSIYHEIGRTEGYEDNPDNAPRITYPTWNDPGWLAHYRAFISEFGARYDGDPRIESVWICTGLYGENVTTRGPYDIHFHGFERFCRVAMDAHRMAFPTTPLYCLLGGSFERQVLTRYAVELGIGIKQHSLLSDSPNHRATLIGHQHGHWGLLDALDHASGKVPVGFEHAYPNRPRDAYWAMLLALAYDAQVVDLPVEYLDVLAATMLGDVSLWEWMSRRMRRPLAMWVARDTHWPDEIGWERGEQGPFERGMSLLAGDVEIRREDDGTLWTLDGCAQLGGSADFVIHSKNLSTVTVICNGHAEIATDAKVRQRSEMDLGSGWQRVMVTHRGPVSEVTLTGQAQVHLVTVR